MKIKQLHRDFRDHWGNSLNVKKIKSRLDFEKVINKLVDDVLESAALNPPKNAGLELDALIDMVIFDCEYMKSIDYKLDIYAMFEHEEKSFNFNFSCYDTLFDAMNGFIYRVLLYRVNENTYIVELREILENANNI